MDMKMIKTEAKKTLYSRGNTVHLVLLSILTMFAVMIPVLVFVYSSSLLMTLFDEEGTNILFTTIIPAVLTLAAAVFISLPAISGVYLCGAKVFDGDAPNYIEAYTHGYRSNILSGAMIVLRWIPAIAMLVLALILPNIVSEAVVGSLGDFIEEFNAEFSEILEINIEWLIGMLVGSAVMVALILLAFVLVLITLALTGKLFFFPYFISQGDNIKDALKKSKETMKHHKGIHRRFLGSFIGLLCLSIITLGLLYVFYVLPLMLMTYNTLAERITDGEQINN